MYHIEGKAARSLFDGWKFSMESSKGVMVWLGGRREVVDRRSEVALYALFCSLPSVVVFFCSIVPGLRE